MPYYWTEAIALLDRCTAVTYTGSMKVMPKQLGTLFWFGLGVHAGLMPVFPPTVIQVPDDDDNSQVFKVIASQWPVNATTSHPLQASSRTHQIEYKEHFLEVCLVHLVVEYYNIICYVDITSCDNLQLQVVAQNSF